MTFHFLNGVINDIDFYVIIASLKSETTCKLLNIKSLPWLALRTPVESLGKPCDSANVLKVLPGKLDIKKHSPRSFYLY